MTKAEETTDAVDLKDAAREEPSVPVKDSAGNEVVTGGEDLGAGKVQAKMDVINNQGFFTDGVSSVDKSFTVAAVTGNLEGVSEEPTSSETRAAAEGAESVQKQEAAEAKKAEKK